MRAAFSCVGRCPVRVIRELHVRCACVCMFAVQSVESCACAFFFLRAENPYQKEVEVRVQSFLLGDLLHESTETENKNKNGESQEVQREISHELLDGLEEFRENLVDESTSTEPW